MFALFSKRAKGHKNVDVTSSSFLRVVRYYTPCTQSIKDTYISSKPGHFTNMWRVVIGLLAPTILGLVSRAAVPTEHPGYPDAKRIADNVLEPLWQEILNETDPWSTGFFLQSWFRTHHQVLKLVNASSWSMPFTFYDERECATDLGSYHGVTSFLPLFRVSMPIPYISTRWSCGLAWAWHFVLMLEVVLVSHWVSNRCPSLRSSAKRS